MNFLKVALAELIQPDLPPVLSEVDEPWRCDYCSVRSVCEQIHGGPVGRPLGRVRSRCYRKPLQNLGLALFSPGMTNPRRALFFVSPQIMAPGSTLFLILMATLDKWRDILR